MKATNLPSVAQAVVFINACLGETVVGPGHLVIRTDTVIDFEIIKRAGRDDPHSFALQRLWKVLGTQTYTARPMAKYVSLYEWNFTYDRWLNLLLTNDGKTIIRLFDMGEAL